MSPPITDIIRDLYNGATTRASPQSGLTEPIHIRTGVKQGCPLSPIIFNLAIEPLLREIRAKRDATCYTLTGGKKLQMMVYADDICDTASSPDALQETIHYRNNLSQVKRLRSVAFASSHRSALPFKIECRKGRKVVDSSFGIQGGSPAVLKDGESYRHLGVPTGFRAAQTPTGAIEKMLQDLDSIDKSALAPWQKIDAVSTFISPRLDFIARGGFVYKTLLYPVDKSVKRLVKKWLHLPPWAGAEGVFLLPSQGGAGLLPLVDGINIATITQAYRMLTCKDRFVSEEAGSCLQTVVHKKIGRQASFSEIAEYLNGANTELFERDGGDIRSLWTRARKATMEVRKHTNVRWIWNQTRNEMEIVVPAPGQQPDLARIRLPGNIS